MLFGPSRPDLSLSTAPEFCDYVELDMDRRSVSVRLSGISSPVLTYDEYVEGSWGTRNVPRALFGPILGGADNFATDVEVELCDLVASGVRRFRRELPRGTLTGSGLAIIGSLCHEDPATAELECYTVEDYMRLNGMRRCREDIDIELRRLEYCRVSGEHPELHPYPELTAPGGGCFLS